MGQSHHRALTRRMPSPPSPPRLPIENYLVGLWVTSFDALYVYDEPPSEPHAVMACWNFYSDFRFHAEKRDNRGRPELLGAEGINGHYTIGWNATLGIAEGLMTFEFPADPPPSTATHGDFSEEIVNAILTGGGPAEPPEYRYFIYVNLIMRDIDTFDWLMTGGFYPDDPVPSPERAPIARGVAHRIKLLSGQ